MEPQVLFEKAGEIAVTNHLYQTIPGYLTEEDVRVLSRFGKPLEVIRTIYMDENDGIDLSALDHALWQIRDKAGDYLEIFGTGKPEPKSRKKSKTRRNAR